MPLVKVLAALAFLAALGAQGAASQPALGAQGAEREPDRRQSWLVPSVDPATPSHALLFRPQGHGPFPLAVIAHASTQNALRRAQMPQPDYSALAAFLVARGFAVLVPERLGHGATGGRYREDQGGCDEPDYPQAGRATADQIVIAMEYLRRQSFIRPDRAVIIGHSAGGWDALAVAGEKLDGVAAIIVFAPGRGGPGQRRARRGLRAAPADRHGRGLRPWRTGAGDVAGGGQ